VRINSNSTYLTYVNAIGQPGPICYWPIYLTRRWRRCNIFGCGPYKAKSNGREE
jgi:hypothetical protein